MISYLTPFLKDRNAEIRFITANTLIGIESPKEPILPRLIPLLQDPDVVVRFNLVLSLGETGEASAWAIPFLVASFQDKSSLVRSQAATSLGNMGKAAKVAIPDLILLLKTVPTVGTSGNIDKAIAVDQSSQLREIQQFLSRNRKSPEKLKSDLEYRVKIAPDGTRQALTPLTKESIVFIDHVPFPLEGSHDGVPMDTRHGDS